MKQINKHLKQAVEKGPPHVAAMVTPMQEKYHKYWKKMSDFAAINIVFDPRYKLNLVKFFLSDKGSTQSSANTIKNIKSIIFRWFDCISCQQDNRNNNSNTAEESKSSKQVQTLQATDDNNQFKQYLAGKKSNQECSPTAKLDLYLQDRAVELEFPNFNILNWWNVNLTRFPTLARMAKILLMVPMTSIALESAFLTGGRVLSDSRGRLKPETL